jgi:hypothetical protein
MHTSSDSSLPSALKVLEDNNYPFVDLPNNPADPAWDTIRNELALSLSQFIALKNAKCKLILRRVIFHCMVNHSVSSL